MPGKPVIAAQLYTLRDSLKTPEEMVKTLRRVNKTLADWKKLSKEFKGYARAVKLKGRLDQVHLKDWGVMDDKEIWRAIGEGGIDWPAVFQACKAAGTRDYSAEQDSCPVTNDPFLSQAISRRNIKAMGLG